MTGSVQFDVGDRVEHEDYGAGHITAREGDRSITVAFDGGETKQFASMYAPLSVQANGHTPTTSWAPVDPEELDWLTAAMGVLTRDQLDQLPPIQPLIEDTLDRRTLALLAGYWGTGKTFIALDWALSAITFRPWQSRAVHDRTGEAVTERADTNARPYHALYVAAEGAYGISQRVSAWEAAWGRKAERLQVMPQALNLLAASDVAKFVRYVELNRIDMVVIDTLSRCMPGADENSAKDMSLAVVALEKIKAATNDGMVLAVHHTGKDKTTVRGSSVLEGACDTVYQVEGDAAYMKLTRTKRKDGPTFDQLTLALSTSLESCVVEDVRGQSQGPSQDRLFRVFMDNFADMGASKAELRGVADMASATYHRALKNLLSDGRLVNVASDSRPFYKPGEVGSDGVR